MARDAALALAAAALLCLALLHPGRGSSAGPSLAAAPAHAAWAPHTLPPVEGPAELAGVRVHPERAGALPRLRPSRVVASADGRRAWVSLAGTEVHPGNEVAAVDVHTRRELGRVVVGSMPQGMALDPTGRWLFVTNRLSNWLSVVDVQVAREVARVPVPPYCEDIVVAPDGLTAWVSNFWKDQVLVVDLRTPAGAVRDLGTDGVAFRGSPEVAPADYACAACGFVAPHPARPCPRCGGGGLSRLDVAVPGEGPGAIAGIIRGRCGSSGCHLHRRGGFYAGADLDELRTSAMAHITPGSPDSSPLLRVGLPVSAGGRADRLDGWHHAGGVVFEAPDDPDLVDLREWIEVARPGPGVAVGDAPRDMALSPDGSTLYVANTGSLDVSIVDVGALREVGRIFTRSPVNDLAFCGGRLLLATLGVGSGHPKARHPGRESLDPDGPETEFTLLRDPSTGVPWPLADQHPLGPYDDVDGTAQEKFRDITNDLVLLDPTSSRDVASYRATQAYTRVTSDTFEALADDAKGDVPPELLRVAGAFPEQLVCAGDRAWVTMSGTFEVQPWHVDAAAPPAERLRAEPTLPVGLKPTGIALAGDTLVVADQLSDTLTFIDVASGRSDRLALDPDAPRYPATDFERGELVVQTSVFSADQDQSCVHCHYRDTSDGKRWSVSQVMGQSRDGAERTGGSREVPDLRNLVDEVPLFLEGVLSIDEALTMMMEHNPLGDFRAAVPAGDFTGVFADPADDRPAQASADSLVVARAAAAWEAGELRLSDLLARREAHFGRVSEQYLGSRLGFREVQRLIGVYQAGAPRLLPNPVDPDDERLGEMVRHGEALFERADVGCAGCHPAPTFTDKVHVHNDNRAFPPLVSAAARDDVHTLVSADRLDALLGYVRDWDPDDRGRVEHAEGFFAAPSLRGLWARPPRLLHHGGARSLREVVCSPGHPALRAPTAEVGLNERDGVPDTHGATSHLTVWDVECLLAFLGSIQ